MKEEKKTQTNTKNTASKTPQKRTPKKGQTSVTRSTKGTTPKKSTKPKTNKPAAEAKKTKSTNSKTTVQKKKTTTNNLKETKKKITNNEETIIAASVKEGSKVLSKKELTNEDKTLIILRIIAAVLFIILLCLICYKRVNISEIFTDVAYKKNGYNTSYLLDKEIVNRTTCDDLSNATTGAQSFVYVTSLGDEEEYVLEKKLAKVINEYHLNDNFYLYELNDNCRSMALTYLQLNEDFSINPMILYYKDGNLQEKITRLDNKTYLDGDLVKVLDIYEIRN